MSRKISELKAMAREDLKGKYSLLIGATLLVSLIGSMGSSLAASLFRGDSLFDFIMGQVVSVIVSLIASVFSVGLYYMYLKTARKEKAGYGDMVYLFMHQPDRVILVSMVTTAVQYICLLPYFVKLYRIGNLVLADLGAQELLTNAGQLSLYFLAGTLVTTILTLPLSLSFYLLIDHEEMEAGEAIRTSVKLMKGNYGRYIYLLLSFLGLLLLGLCGFYIGILWVGVYLQMAEVEFYRELTGELEKKETIRNFSEEAAACREDYGAEA